MASINLHPTVNYSQPSEYRFSHDSVFFARKVFEEYLASLETSEIEKLNCLDCCSGCGIIGLDLQYHLIEEAKVQVNSFDFLEVQAVYREHFEVNKSTLNVSTPMRFLNQNYDNLLEKENHKKYDLIVCNPPYFRIDQGKLSPSDFKNRCRFYIDSDFTSLINGIVNSVSDNGRAYILLKQLSDHGLNVFSELEEILRGNCHVIKVFTVRSTDVVMIQRI